MKNKFTNGILGLIVIFVALGFVELIGEMYFHFCPEKFHTLTQEIVGSFIYGAGILVAVAIWSFMFYSIWRCAVFIGKKILGNSDE